MNMDEVQQDISNNDTLSSKNAIYGKRMKWLAVEEAKHLSIMAIASSIFCRINQTENL